MPDQNLTAGPLLPPSVIRQTLRSPNSLPISPTTSPKSSVRPVHTTEAPSFILFLSLNSEFTTPTVLPLMAL